MQRSDTRILTTHTGSLPRPASLVRLYVAKARGEAVDADSPQRAMPHWKTQYASSATPASTLATTASSSARLSSSMCAAA